MTRDFYRFSVGSFECTSLKDGEKDYSLTEIFADAPLEEVRSRLRATGLTEDRVTTPFTYLHVDAGGREILVDAGAGAAFPTTGKLLASMAAAEIDPAAIDLVIITHAHPDHLGGMLLDDGSPAFPNASYVISKREWEFWHSEQARERASEAQRWFFDFACRHLDPFRSRMRLLDPAGKEAILQPGIGIWPTPGHTPGHLAVEIASGEESLLYIGDAAILPIHLAEPTWHPVYDLDPAAADSSKRFIFDRAAERHSWVVGQHFPPFPSLGHVVRRAKGWAWEALDGGA